MKSEGIIELLKTMPMGLTSRIKIGENQLACKQLNCTINDIKLHNAESKGFDEGYRKAVKEFEKWREEITAKIIYS